MVTINSTDMRKDFGGHIDTIVRTKPLFIKRSRDYFMGINIEMAKELVKDVVFKTKIFSEDDNSVTMSLQDFDIVVNEINEERALNSLIDNLREYATEYYEDINFWMTDPIRKNQFSSILKVLMVETNDELKESFICRTGEN